MNGEREREREALTLVLVVLFISQVMTRGSSDKRMSDARGEQINLLTQCDAGTMKATHDLSI